MDFEVELRITERAKADPFYQDLLAQCQSLGEDYRRIMDDLSEEDREKLELYISTCEELEYQRTRIAYALGIWDGALSGIAGTGKN